MILFLITVATTTSATPTTKRHHQNRASHRRRPVNCSRVPRAGVGDSFAALQNRVVSTDYLGLNTKPHHSRSLCLTQLQKGIHDADQLLRVHRLNHMEIKASVPDPLR